MIQSGRLARIAFCTCKASRRSASREDRAVSSSVSNSSTRFRPSNPVAPNKVIRIAALYRESFRGPACETELGDSPGETVSVTNCAGFPRGCVSPGCVNPGCLFREFPVPLAPQGMEKERSADAEASNRGESRQLHRPRRQSQIVRRHREQGREDSKNRPQGRVKTWQITP